MNRSTPGLVLQGCFRVEPFAGAGHGAAVVPSNPGSDWRAHAPRPELMPAPLRPPAIGAWMTTPVLQARGAPRSALAAQPARLPDVLQARLRALGPGTPLAPAIRDRAEHCFGADFSEVRVHVTPAARGMGALALTQGETLYFAPGRYDATTRQGMALLGHELTHVVQQRSGRVVNRHGRGIEIVRDPELDAEADAWARRLVDRIWPDQRTAQASRSPGVTAPTRVPPMRAGGRVPPGPPRPGVLQAMTAPPPGLEPALPAAVFSQKNTLILASYNSFMPHVKGSLDCGVKVVGLLKMLRRDLKKPDDVDRMGLAIRIVRNKDRSDAREEIALRGGWSGEYHVYLRSEDDQGHDLLYDPYIDASNCRGNTSEDVALPALWKTPMTQLECITVAGVGTDIPVSEYMNSYTGNWEALVEHALARQLDSNLSGTFTDW